LEIVVFGIYAGVGKDVLLILGLIKESLFWLIVAEPDKRNSLVVEQKRRRRYSRRIITTVVRHLASSQGET